MREELAKPSRVDYRSRCIVAFVPTDQPPLSKRLLHGGDGRVSRIPHGFKDQLLALRRFAAYNSGPGNVVEHTARFIEASPDVDEDKIAFADGSCFLSRRLIVRVGAVGIGAHVGAIFPN